MFYGCLGFLQPWHPLFWTCTFGRTPGEKAAPIGGNWAAPLHRKGKLSAKKSQRNCGWQNKRQFWVYLEELYRFLSRQFLPIGF